VGRAVPTKATVKSARKGAMGSKKGQKCRLHRLAIVVSDGNDGEEADDSDGGFVAIVKRDFKWQTRSPKDHFEKLLEATDPHHPYPVKHKLRDCSMMKKFMMSGALSRDDKPGGDLGGTSVTPIPDEAEIMAISG
jgi:hypothetical protein